LVLPVGEKTLGEPTLMLNKRNIPITRPSVGEEEWLALREPIMNGWLTQGPKVAEFEQVFGERHGTKHALATTSCTTALHLALATLGIGENDEVIVPAFTWIATANAVAYCGATPVFVDVLPHTYNIAPRAIARAISPRTRAIIAVHLFGLCADMDEIRCVAGNIPIIEDAACAVGAEYRGRPAGSLGELGCFSFHPRKTITTGEGGMVTTDDDVLAEAADALRNHGASISEEQRHAGPRPYLMPDFDVIGFNYRMTDLQGALGLVQLAKLDDLLLERHDRALFYQDEFSGIPWLTTPMVPSDRKHAWQAYVCHVDEERSPLPRNLLMEKLQARGISTRPGTHAVHMTGVYRQAYDFNANQFPVAKDCDQSTLALPLFGGMSDDDYDFVVKELKSIG